MEKNQLTGIIWVILAIVYGVGGVLIMENWWWTIGGAFIAIVAVSTPIWTRWLPDDVD